MARPAHDHLDARTRRRQLLRLDRRRERARLRLRKGQTLIIFALTITVLLGLAGLVIDVARAYDLYAKMQRAADAGALAGVLYMPTYYNSPRTPGDGLSAVARATSEIYKDGFGSGVSTIPASNPCPTPYSSVEIAICQVPNAQTDVEVIITEHLNVVLLGGLGLGPITLTAHSQAEYLPQVQIVSRENYFGDQVECSPGGSSNTNTTACLPNATGVNHLQTFMATLNGPAELKESGDPFVYCAEGNAEAATLTPNNLPTGPDPTTSGYTYNGYQSNHPQWPGIPTGTTYTGGIVQHCGVPVPGGNPGNPDYQPQGYDGPATAGTLHDGGYNYFIGLAPGAADSSLWIYNPYYIPQDASGSPLPLDHFIDGGTSSPNFYQGPDGNGIGSRFDGVHHDAPMFYYAISYTLYQINNLYDRSSDNLIATETFSPYDNTSADLTEHGCASGQVYNPYWSGGDTPNTYHKPAFITSFSGCVSASTLTSVCASDLAWCPLVNCGTWTPSTTSTSSPSSACTLSGAAVLHGSTAYRLVVEPWGIADTAKNPNGGNDYVSTTTYGWGQHNYALKVCAATVPGLTTPINCPNGDGSNGAGGFNNTVINIYGWNNSDVNIQEPLSTANANANYPQTSCVENNASPYACIDLGCIPTVYAGRTITAKLFDPGDGSGTLYAGVAPPPGKTTGSNPNVTIIYDNTTSTSVKDGITVVQAHTSTGYRPFNGVWLNITIKLSSSYQGDCFSTGTKTGNSGWFQIVYIGNTTSDMPNNKLGIEFNTVGSPVHLVPPQLF